jgi:polyisoprenoid-binding protein YceI
MSRWLSIAVLLVASSARAGPQDAWTVDTRTSTLTFTASQVGSIISGRFSVWTASIVLDPASLGAARIAVRIEMPATTANNRDLETLLKGASFFDVQKFPEARFAATAIVAKGGDRYEAPGKLTIRGVTRDVVLPFTLAIADDPTQAGRLRASARGRLVLKRLDFGVGQNEWAGTGQVANEVTIDLGVVASRAK